MARSPRILLVYPEFPPSYWGFRYAIELMDKRSAMPPLGLLTVAAMIPARFELRLVEVNVALLTDEDLDWADLVLTSSMVVQRRSLQEVIARAKRRGKPVAVGGPHPTSFADEIAGADYYVLDEVEETFPLFLADWEAGRAQRLYRPGQKPALTTTPVPRTKSNPPMLAELDALYDLGWRGPNRAVRRASALAGTQGTAEDHSPRSAPSKSSAKRAEKKMPIAPSNCAPEVGAPTSRSPKPS